MALTPNGVNTKHLTTSKSKKIAGEENLEIKEANFPLLEYANRASIMAVTEKSAPKIILFAL